MGYTHYYKRNNTAPASAYDGLLSDTARIIEHSGVPLEDTVDGEIILINGVDDLGHETFVWPNDYRGYLADCMAEAGGTETGWGRSYLEKLGEFTSGAMVFDFCKTAEKPYDEVVTAILIRAKHHYGTSVEITSDGVWSEWSPGAFLCVELFGEARCPWDTSNVIAELPKLVLG